MKPDTLPESMRSAIFECTQCHESKSGEEFYWSGKQENPHRASECIRCIRARAKRILDLKRENPEWVVKQREYMRSYTSKNRPHLREVHRRWESAHPEQMRGRRERAAQRIKERRKTDPEWAASHRRRDVIYRKWRLYGLTLADLDAILATQNNRCPICQRPFESALRPQVDHDHSMTHIRGLLCNSCNLAIGQLGESIPRLQRAVRYLRSGGINRAIHLAD